MMYLKLPVSVGIVDWLSQSGKAAPIVESAISYVQLHTVPGDSILLCVVVGTKSESVAVVENEGDLAEFKEDFRRKDFLLMRKSVARSYGWAG